MSLPNLRRHYIATTCHNKNRADRERTPARAPLCDHSGFSGQLEVAFNGTLKIRFEQMWDECRNRESGPAHAI